MQKKKRPYSGVIHKTVGRFERSRSTGTGQMSESKLDFFLNEIPINESAPSSPKRENIEVIFDDERLGDVSGTPEPSVEKRLKFSDDQPTRNFVKVHPNLNKISPEIDHMNNSFADFPSVQPKGGGTPLANSASLPKSNNLFSKDYAKEYDHIKELVRSVCYQFFSVDAFTFLTHLLIQIVEAQNKQHMRNPTFRAVLSEHIVNLREILENNPTEINLRDAAGATLAQVAFLHKVRPTPKV